MNWSFLGKVNLSQKKFFWGLIAIAAALAAYTFLVIPLVEAQKEADQAMALNQRILLKYGEILSNRKAVEEGLARTQKQREEIQKRLIPGETPQLGAAHLQDLVKRLAEKNNLGLRSFRNLDPKEAGSFRRISVQIEFNPLSSMQNLTQFLYELEHQEQELRISEMDLLVFNPRMPNTIQGNLIISGLMKGSKGKDQEKGREK
ncbi:MAG: Type secretion system protein subtype b [Deltaproteobacteria bacterium]|nr:Type secretion system protein subtype b [Deltaproteobacteria bacterium]